MADETNVYEIGKGRMVIDANTTTRRDRNCKYFIGNIEVPREDFVAYCRLVQSEAFIKDPRLLES